MSDWKRLLEQGHEFLCHQGETRLSYLCMYVFDITTYAGEMDELFGRHAVEVCRAINDGKTFDYIADESRHVWYLVMVNMPFFAGRIEWGTSIRGAWWDHRDHEFDAYGLADENEQLGTLKLSRDEWREFIAALVEFATPSP
jgi:hypothetical protein